MTLIATGDAFITRRFPEGGYEGFEQVRDVISQYDVKFSNLEMTFHNEEGYPAAFSGGTWAMADPRTLDDMKSFGFNLFNTANNHSCDYSHGGILNHAESRRERHDLCRNRKKSLRHQNHAIWRRKTDVSPNDCGLFRASMSQEWLVDRDTN